MAAPIPPWLGALAGMSVSFVFGDVAWKHRDTIVHALEPAPATQAAFLPAPGAANTGNSQIKAAALINHSNWRLTENSAVPPSSSDPSTSPGQRYSSRSSYSHSYGTGSYYYTTPVYVYNYQTAPTRSQSQRAQPSSGYGPTSLLRPLYHRRLTPGTYGHNVRRP